MTANMKASELRLGNLVNWGVNIVPIKSIHTESVLKDEVRVYVELNEKLQNYCLDITEIEPTPLTEEWLLKFGFTLCENDSWYEKKIPNLGIVLSCNLHGRFCIEHADEIVTIKECCYNVHELQNLYFALVREELTFKSE